jgi:hypothetical protein
MKTLLFSLLLSTMPMWCFAQEKPQSTPVDGKIEWVFDLEQARKKARDSDKPVFIVFRCER